MSESLIATIGLLLVATLAVAGSAHALVYKRDPRAALGWIGMCLVLPLFGPLLYFLFGVNRIQTRAQRLTRQTPFRLGVGYERGDYGWRGAVVDTEAVEADWQSLATISGALTRRPLLRGNRIEPLANGESAYPAMLAAIDGAQSHVYLSTYIFDADETGRRFIDALAHAQRRGVMVRVLVDGIGELYSLPRASRLLQQRGARVERFMPPSLWPPSLHLNLRNHRKILAVDGEVAFIGGMNIGDRHLVEGDGRRHRLADLHFRCRGPVVSQIETIFAEDWRFVTRELVEPTPIAREEPVGPSVCRAFTDGPNEDLDTLALVLNGAAGEARERIDIMTPYFVPPPTLVAALQTAALRGVRVRLLLPARSNLAYVHWATRNMLGELLAFGVEVHYQPGPLAHAKLFVVDARYAIIGSANVDSRSLRLNFELATEIFCRDTAAELARHCDRAAARSRALTQAEIDERSLPVRMRDAACWLFSPYL
jgi:cardiolipin synthase